MTLEDWIYWDDRNQLTRGQRGHDKRELHLYRLTRSAIEAETRLSILYDALEYLKRRRPIRGKRGGHPTTEYIMWVNNQVRALERADAIPAGENWLSMQGEINDK